MRAGIDYVIRDWGEGYWRWDCLHCQRGRRDGYGVLGPPFKLEDVRREAAGHVAAHHQQPVTVAGE